MSKIKIDVPVGVGARHRTGSSPVGPYRGKVLLLLCIIKGKVHQSKS
jgi:hypothetical protein